MIPTLPFMHPYIEGKPEWSELTRFALDRASQHVRITRERRHMDVGWNGRENLQWVWDSCFMALYSRYAPEALPGMASLDNFYDLQREDGYIGMCYDLDSGAEPWPDRINPPLFAWAEREYWRTTGDASRLERVLPHLERLHDWIDANRRTEPHRKLRADDSPEDGQGESENCYQLYWFKDGGSSGMDDSPRTPRLPGAGQFFDWIDLSSQMALACRCLAEMHGATGASERAAYWQNRHQQLAATINEELWCPQTGFYHDRTLPTGFVPSKTAAGFWPMLAGICAPEQLDQLEEHLRNPAEFNRPVPVPVLSADDPNYRPDGAYWRGGVWAPTNYMIIRGLASAGRRAEAHRIATRYLDALATIYRDFSPNTLWESVAAEKPAPGLTAYTGERVRPDFCGWSAIGPTALFIENIIGIEVDAVTHSVHWDIRLEEAHGVGDLPIGHGMTADLHFRPADNGGVVEVRSAHPFDLMIHRNNSQTTARVPGSPSETFKVQI